MIQFYHELKSHIEDSTGDVDEDHIKYGTDSFKLIAPRTTGSPSDVITNQLLKVREENKNKKNEKKK